MPSLDDWRDEYQKAMADKKNARKITRYSDEYFELVTRHGKHVAKYLALEGHVIVVLDGQTYEF